MTAPELDPALLARYRRDYEASRRNTNSGVGWLSLQDGVNVVRILPPYEESDPYNLVIGQHYNLGGNRRANVFCPRFTFGTDGKTPLVDWDCPVCDYTDLVKGSARRGRELTRAKELGVTVRWICQALDRDDDVDAPLLWSFGLPVYEQLLGYLTGPCPDLYDVDEGQDIAVRKTRQERATRYHLTPEGGRSPVSDAALRNVIDLKGYIRSRIFRPEELERILAGEEPSEVLGGITPA